MLRKLGLQNTEITDVSMRYITQYLPHLSSLNLSGCWKLSDTGLAQLGVTEFSAVETLTHLDISSCRALTDNGLSHLYKYESLIKRTELSTN